MFAERPRSYKELPLRYADFSPLHRNESSGALAGLTRVRKFHQDDGHIFCRESQVFEEIARCLEFLDIVYRQVFKFPNYTLTLSTRPTNGKVVGTLEEWNRAEAALTAALDQTGKPWQLKPGDGAFYGPKIDIMVNDVFDRAHQTATIQLDFQLPRRFALKYQSETGMYEAPVIIHRAILGSLERMLAILIEHYAGKWPFWLSPRQAMVVSVGGGKFAAYAHQVQQWLRHPATYAPLPSQNSSALPSTEAAQPAHSLVSSSIHDFFHVDVDSDPSRSLNRMVRDAQLSRYNFILVVGEKEAATQTVNVRTRDSKILGAKTVAEVIAMFRQLQADYD
ncbi:threonyl-tRNA synthetase [Dimargaris xerosporica]|nr:threonyl-tRNA synthetase [Dimargaris xerosporica]